MPPILNIIICLLPLTIYVWTGFGRIYRAHNAFTKRWPSLSELGSVLAQPGISSRKWGSIYRFRVLLISYYVLVAFAVLGYAVFFFI